MTAALVVCPSCSRHVRASESACPFCARLVPAGLVPVPSGPRRPYIGKGATALALTLAAASGCSSEETTTPVADVGAQEVQGDTASATDTFTPADTFTPEDTMALDSASDSDVSDDGGAFPLYK